MLTHPKLLIVGTLHSLPTGPRVALRNLVEELEKRNIPYDLVDFSSSDLSRRDGTFTWGRAFEITGIFFKYVRHLANSPRMLYLHMGQSRVSFLRDCSFIWPASLLDYRVIVHLRGGNYDTFYNGQASWMRWLIRTTLERVEKIIILSPLLEGCFGFLSNAKARMEVVPNGIPFDLEETIAPGSLRPGEPVRLLYLSNMIESKGYWDVLEACRILKTRGVPFSCDFCGAFLAASDDRLYQSTSDARTAFLETIQEWQLEREVKWHGSVDGEEKLSMLRNAHVFILPTRYNNEGMPISIIEALAFGKAIISTRYRAIPDMLSDGANGFFVDSDSPGQIADKVVWLWSNPRALTQMSKNSLEKYRLYFTMEQHLSRLLSVLGNYLPKHEQVLWQANSSGSSLAD